MDPGTIACLGYQLHHRLQEVDVQPQEIMDTVEGFISLFLAVAVIAYYPSHDGPILLLHVAAVVFLVGT